MRALARIGARLLVAAVDLIARGDAAEWPQNNAEATYAHRLTKDDGVIDWSWPAIRIHNMIRGLHPWPHAFSFVHGKRVILRRSQLDAAPGLLDESQPDDGGSVAATPPGSIVEADGDRLIVATGDGTLRLTEIQVEGKRPMTARDFLAGHRLLPGERFAPAP